MASRRGRIYLEEAHDLFEAFEAGEFAISAPRLMQLELLNMGARSWRLDEQELHRLALRVEGFGFAYADPDLARVARWAAGGLTAYDASYVALAEQLTVPLITEDRAILEAAPAIAVSLAQL